jgi:voltage-gated potassium channel
VLDYADTAFCLLFFIDFCLNLWRAEARGRYLLTWGWLDLLSSLPVLDAARWGRVARMTRIFRVLRAVRAAKLLGRVLIERRAQSGLLAAALVAILVMVASSVSVLPVETGESANIRTAEDAAWWSLTTMTTVGYGDRFPVTTEGRFVAAVLMCAGVGLFGTFSGLLAAWFVGHDDGPDRSAELAAALQEVAALKAALAAQIPAPTLPRRQDGG